MPVHPRPSERTDDGGTHAPVAIVPSPLFTNLLVRLPEDVQLSLTEKQRAHISQALARSRARHLVEYRASIPFLGRRYYVTLLAGRERRSTARLIEEGQTDIVSLSYLYLALIVFVVGGMTICLVVFLYLVKSALGIDLFDGPSPFHHLFFARD